MKKRVDWLPRELGWVKHQVLHTDKTPTQIAEEFKEHFPGRTESSVMGCVYNVKRDPDYEPSNLTEPMEDSAAEYILKTRKLQQPGRHIPMSKKVQEPTFSFDDDDRNVPTCTLKSLTQDEDRITVTLDFTGSTLHEVMSALYAILYA